MLRESTLALGVSLIAAPLLAQSPQETVDEAFNAIAARVTDAELDPVIEIDHARLASEAGVEMPASRVMLFSDARIDSEILAAEIRAGLDLPYRILAFNAAGNLAVRTTDSAFLKWRHGLDDLTALETWELTLETVLAPVLDAARAAPVEGLTSDYGVIELSSPYDLAKTAQRLKDAVTAQGDTIWFGEHDFQARASALGVDLPGSLLLLFGGPAPGGVAMAEYPSIGLDAFCQKLFLYEDETGSVKVLFNGIAALAELHYGSSAPPHKQLDQRLTQTFTSALAE